MFCSVIIPTVGRATLERAVNSVLQQTLTAAPFEIIVVNDSAAPLPLADWLESKNVQLLHTQKKERSCARNLGAAVAQGHYLYFLDDDDWLAPNALQHLWELAQTATAAWLYGSSQLVTDTGQPIIQLHHGLQGNGFLHVMAGEWIPLQASCIRSDAFFEIGGFNPLLAGPEDIDLLRRIALRWDIAETPHIVAYVIRGQADTTTDYDRHPERSRWAREQILNMPNVAKRLRAAATSGYWHGRIVRIYLTSVIWNLRRGRFFTAVSRGTQALIALMLASQYIFSPSFWKSISHAYDSDTFQRGFAAAQQN